MSEPTERKSKREGKEVKGKGIKWSAYLICIFTIAEGTAGSSEGNTNDCALEKFDDADGKLHEELLLHLDHRLSLSIVDWMGGNCRCNIKANVIGWKY